MGGSIDKPPPDPKSNRDRSSVIRIDHDNNTASITSRPPDRSSSDQTPAQAKVVVGMVARNTIKTILPSDDSPQATETQKDTGEGVIKLTKKKGEPSSPDSEGVILLDKPKEQSEGSAKDDPITGESDEAKTQWQAPQWAPNHKPETPKGPEEDEDIIDLTGMEVADKGLELEKDKSDGFPDIEITVQPPQIDEAILDKIGLYKQMCDEAERTANSKRGQEFRADRIRSLRTSLTNLSEDQSMDPETKEQKIIEIFNKIREILIEDEIVLAEKIEDLDNL
ncbi:hypothetical protein KKA33_01965 [Patescibacteria group bacterium]|nr:hypothetical protein [Patescibacteria group bacterium]